MELHNQCQEIPGVRIMMILGIAVLVGVGLSCTSERTFGAYDGATHTWNTPEGKKVEDRVSGRLINAASAIQRVYLGEVYYFENEFDARMFDQNPGAYSYRDPQPR